MSNKIIFILLAIAVVGGALLYFSMGSTDVVVENIPNEDIQPYEIAPGDVVEKIQEGKDVILLDVRTPEEYADVHLENALLLPVQKLAQGTLDALDEIGLGQDKKGKEIIIYCRSGKRSKMAYDIMQSLGYTNVKSVAGGIIHWQEGGYPLIESGE